MPGGSIPLPSANATPLTFKRTYMRENNLDEFGFELSGELIEKMKKREEELKKEGKFQKPSDSPYECVGCGS